MPILVAVNECEFGSDRESKAGKFSFASRCFDFEPSVPPLIAAWLAVIAFNLNRAAATLSTTDRARATTATVRRTLIQIPCRIATSARRLIMHLPKDWPWQTAWTQLNDRVAGPPAAIS
jgi:hypothetical protein